MRRNYHRKLWGEIIKGNYEEKLSQEIIRRNDHSKLSASIYQHAKNVGIIGILAYPKIKSKRKRRNRHVPLPFRGKRAENWLHNVRKSLGEELAVSEFGSFRVSEFQSFFVSCRRTYVLNNQMFVIFDPQWVKLIIEIEELFIHWLRTVKKTVSHQEILAKKREYLIVS